MKPRLAILEFHHLGDAVMALPFLRGAREKYEPVVFCRAHVAEFLRLALPGVEIHGPPDSWPARLKSLRAVGRSWEAAACVWPDTRAHFLMALSGAEIRAGFPVSKQNYYAPHLAWRKRRLFAGRWLGRLASMALLRPLLNRPVTKPDTRQRHIESWSQLAGALGFAPEFSLPWIPWPRSRSEGILVHAGGRLPGKRWPGFPELLRGVLHDHRVTILAPPGEPHPEPAVPRHRVLATPDFSTLLDAVSGVEAVVANDSFVAHLAAALGKPVVTIFGSGEPDWFAPFGNHQRAVISRVCPHHPCIDRCLMPSYVCLEAVTPAQVTEAVRDMIEDLKMPRP